MRRNAVKLRNVQSRAAAWVSEEYRKGDVPDSSIDRDVGNPCRACMAFGARLHFVGMWGTGGERRRCDEVTDG